MYKLNGYDVTYDHPDYNQLALSPDPCAVENTKYLIATFLTKEEAEAYVEKAKLRQPDTLHEFRAKSLLRHYKEYEIVSE